ncbi:hypothetical protein BGW36DRAFT_371165 [Talaromyces proteolyticus]|uniref:Uncharacterized protein n=1 Tax=Talaromyces proteolyticus TaxID=1131652 RepID=A0AAD4PYK0_9EURO|nr:uncharacterized protein BGW36DRAFT_371165 [Talaromyces proteolyticus]KAH8701600.1 hypothetical protein BGW36DRAFT_371165 [Talaromyces proteolyticus]
MGDQFHASTPYGDQQYEPSAGHSTVRTTQSVISNSSSVFNSIPIHQLLPPMHQQIVAMPTAPQQGPDYGRDELISRFLGWELTVDIRGTLSDAKKNGKPIATEWFELCKKLEEDYASKGDACRNFTYDTIWRPMKLENYYNFIKEETAKYYSLEYGRIDWARIDRQDMAEPRKEELLENLVMKGESLAGCVKILKDSFPRISPSTNNPWLG